MTDRTDTGRNVLVLIGLWAGAGLLAGPLALAWNTVMVRVSASSPAGVVGIQLLWTIPFLLPAVFAGFGVRYFVTSTRQGRWAIALAVLLCLQSIGTSLQGRLDWDLAHWVGAVAAGLVLAAGSLVGYRISVRRYALNTKPLSGHEKEPVSEHLFAFGSNMCSGRLRDYSVFPERPGEPALLSGYRLRFNKRSQDGSGKANVERDPAGEVWGVLYAIPDDHLPVLDHAELGYARQREVVRTSAGATSEAWVFVAVSPDTDAALRPYGWYKRFLVEGAREHGLPDPYVKALEAIESRDDTDAARDRKKRSLRCEGARSAPSPYPTPDP